MRTVRSGNNIKNSKNKYIELREKIRNADNPNIVGIGDIVFLTMYYLDNEQEDLIVQLVDGKPNMGREDIKIISIESPIGDTILGKSINSILDCKGPEETFKIEITDIKKHKKANDLVSKKMVLKGNLN